MIKFIFKSTVATWLLLAAIISLQPATAEESGVVENQPNISTSNVEKSSAVAEIATPANVQPPTPSTPEFIVEETQTKVSVFPTTEKPSQKNTTVSNKASDLIVQNAQPNAPVNSQTQDILNELNELPNQKFETPAQDRSLSPAFTISNPNGFGADNNTLFVVADYQARTRYTNKNDGELGIGIGLGDAKKAVGVELSYTIDSFGRHDGKFASGFNAKVHRRVDNDSSVAIGWNHFARIESPAGYGDYPKNSYYGTYTKIFRTKEFVEEPLSRVAVTVGVGSGQFLSEDTINDAFNNGKDPTGLNVFGSVAVRLAKPVSAIVEWTGQDLALGVSVVPFKNVPFVITPAIRDITGAGDGARFVLGTGFSYQF